jgi:hypothetical protein
VGLRFVLLGSSSELSVERHTVSELQATISSLVSHPVTSTVTSVTNGSALTVTTTRYLEFPNVPWDTVWFMVPPDGGNTAFGRGGNLSKALLFSCPTAATDGCTLHIYNDLVRANFSITVWYPRIGQANEPAWANCEYSVIVLPGGQPVPGGPGFAYCIPIGASAFVVAEQGSIPAWIRQCTGTVRQLPRLGHRPSCGPMGRGRRFSRQNFSTRRCALPLS